jgi:hypothetical protein
MYVYVKFLSSENLNRRGHFARLGLSKTTVIKLTLKKQSLEV